MGLFEPPSANFPATTPPSSATPSPLADRMRPETIDDFVGQLHIMGPGKALRRQIERDELG